MHKSLTAISLWFQRLWWAQHNARVLADMEWRISLLVEHATGGRMSKAYYTFDQMRVEVDAAQSDAYQDGYADGTRDALEEHGLTATDTDEVEA